MFVIYNSYAWAFYIGSVFIQKLVWNNSQNRIYSGGDILACFFGIIIGLFSLSACSNHVKAVIEGRVAAKFAFEVIERVPGIILDSGAKHTLKGEVTLKDVNFYYPTRPDSKVLKNFNATFELGKTTAIVGPSGAGKSSIAQMIVRFYDPTSGCVLVDGVPIKDINLIDYRKQIGYVS
jgi:ATP-binding cassette, subfamily B (MDR/TAP), member 1